MGTADILTRRLEQFGPLSDEEKQVLDRAISQVKEFGADQDVVREGDRPSHSSLILEGFACRQKHVPDGGRQITAFHVPGDFCDLHSFLLKKMDDGVVTLTPCKVALVPHKTIRQITTDYPYLTRLLWFTTLIDAAVHREWMLGMGRLSPSARTAHLFCELFVRLKSVGLTEGNAYRFPITQAELGDAFGLSTVHVNRTLQELREQRVLTLERGILTICDWERLQEMAAFSPDYLHVGQKIERN